MSSVPFIPDHAPFSAEQRAWLNGFFAGVFSRALAPAHTSTLAQPVLPATPPPTTTPKPLTVLFGSQTGTAESLAKRAAKTAAARGFKPTVLDMAAATLPALASAGDLLVITSTYGEGEPPDSARALHAAVTRPTADTPRLPGNRYSVCALGDTNYPLFCQCGKDFDTALAQLGAQRVHPRVDCELDYEAAFTTWLDQSLSALAQTTTHTHSAATASSPTDTTPPPSPAAPADTRPAYSRAHPFRAPVLAVRPLVAPGSAKEVNHIEFSLAGSALHYTAGDALGVFPHNSPTHVADLLQALHCDGEEPVPTPTGETSLRQALTRHYDLSRPTPDLLQLLALDTPGATPPPFVLDAVLAATAAAKPRTSPAAFVASLKKLQPRLYSISSSPHARPGQVDLTVGAVRYELGGRPRLGVCSTFLADHALTIGHAEVFIHHNTAFRLPASGDTPVIMVGPGTGIAPFRAFLQDRQASGARGRNWLFFGDQHAATDFLYRDELTALQQAGVLTRLDTAFSRDQAAKIYVQHRLLETAAELYAWLEAGAHFYVCGDASRMAKDVDAALHAAIASASGRSADAAADYVQALRAARRYQRDVY